MTSPDSSSRRSLFRKAATAAAGWAAMAHSLKAASSSATPANEDFWRLVKKQFPLEDGLLYFNAANICPASRAVLDRHAEFLRDFQANPSFQNRAKYDAMRSRLRAKLAGVLQVQPDEVAITRNTSEGNNLIVHGLDLKAGDEVLLTEHNHPSNFNSWKVRASREGFTVRTLAVPVPAASKDQVIDLFQRAITPKTRVISVSHVTNTAGLLFPARELAALAHRNNAWFHLDGAQTFGALDLNLKTLDCDSYTSSTHKWMMGPLEAGILYVRAGKQAQVWPSIVSVGWSDTLKGSTRLEAMGQRDDPRLVALESAVDFMTLIGTAQIEARMRHLARSLNEKFRGIPGATVKTNLEPELCGGVVKVLPGKGSPRAMDERLWTKHRIAIAATESGDAAGLRFSPHIYNTMDEIDEAVRAVQTSI
jgi:selenocysteine lyase/cysteine desulfurase